VWAATGPVAVDRDSWVLLGWELAARGLRWSGVTLDGGAAMLGACAVLDPALSPQRDVWHVLHTCATVQARLDRAVATVRGQAGPVARRAARLARGLRPRGEADPAAHAARLAIAERAAAGLRYLSGELRALLEVAVLVGGQLRDAAARQADLAALTALLAELRADTPADLATHLGHAQATLLAALPGLLTFVPALERIEQQVRGRLTPEALALVAWAWQRRAILGPDHAALLAGLPPAWRPAAALLLAAWDQTVRASSLVEVWHSVLRPHLAVHRTLSPGLLALLAVWHNHRRAARGPHQGTSPLARAGLDAPPDWLVALGYPPHADAPAPAPRLAQPLPRAA